MPLHLCPTTNRPAPLAKDAVVQRPSRPENSLPGPPTLGRTLLAVSATGWHRFSVKRNLGFLRAAKKKKRPVSSPKPPFDASPRSQTVRLAEQKLNRPLTASSFVAQSARSIAPDAQKVDFSLQKKGRARAGRFGCSNALLGHAGSQRFHAFCVTVPKKWRGRVPRPNRQTFCSKGGSWAKYYVFP